MKIAGDEEAPVVHLGLLPRAARDVEPGVRRAAGEIAKDRDVLDEDHPSPASSAGTAAAGLIAR